MENQKFGARLRQLRKQAGMTQRELADRVNVDFSYLSKIESGAVPPPSEKVISQLAEALNADKDELTILAGEIPSDIVEILKNRETVQRLRSAHARQVARSSRGGGISIMKQLTNYKRLSKIAIPIALVLAVAASLWYVSPTPVRALEISFPSLPSGNIGRTHSFEVTIDIASDEHVPIQSIDLEIYNVADDSKKVTCNDLPKDDGGTESYSNTDTGGGGTVDVTATALTWEYFSATGYAYWKGYGYDFGTILGYGYQTGTASITYDITWTSPSGWPSGRYQAKVTITATSTVTFIETSDEFSLSRRVVTYVRVAPVELGVYDVSDYVTDEGEFTEDVVFESEDGKVELTIYEETVGLIDEEPLDEISITEMEDPPDPPADSSRIGLTYDLGPAGTTFDPAITLTFTYDEALIPEGAAEKNLVIAIWDGENWVDLPGPFTIDRANNTISTPVSHFTAFAVLAYTGPAAFATTDLVISPTEVDIGETVTISAVVTNTGDLSGDYQVVLEIDNVAVATKDVTLDGDTSQMVTFTTTMDTAGTYAINVNGLSGTVEAKAPPVPPPAPPVAPPAPPPPPPVVPPVLPPAVNWWLIGGIIAGVIIIGVVIWQVIIRRRAY